MAEGPIPAGASTVPGADGNAAPAAPAAPPALSAAGPGQAPPGAPGLDPSCAPGVPCEPPDAPPAECPDVTCKPGPCLYGSVEYLQWWFRRRPLPVLLTTGNFNDPVPGGLGQPGTRILNGQVFEDENGHPGGRLTLGYWLDCARTVSVEGSFFLLEQRSNRASFGAPAAAPQVLARPFVNAITGAEDADPVALPGVMGGSISFSQPARLFGGEINLCLDAPPSIFCFSSFSLLLGARYLALDEKLVEQESLIDLPGLGIQGNQFGMVENFTTFNRFYGGQIGGRVDTRFGPLVFQTTAKVAVGVNREEVNISAFSRVIEPTGVITTATDRGLFVQPSNAGRRHNDQFAAVPEVALNAIYEFNDYFRLNLGYTFLYATNVIRPGNQIDRVVNIQALQPIGQVGPNRPLLTFRDSDFWAQGLTVGLEFSY